MVRAFFTTIPRLLDSLFSPPRLLDLQDSQIEGIRVALEGKADVRGPIWRFSFQGTFA
jgi:hypothetical protein